MSDDIQTAVNSYNWRTLEKDEIIQIGDMYDGCRDPMKDDPVWKPVTETHPRLGQPAPDPKYPAHTLYRREVK